MKISLAIPTRKRVAGLAAFLDSVISMTSDLTKIEVIVRLDTDDSESLSSLFRYREKLNIVTCIKEREQSLGKMYNEMYAVSNGDILGMLSDDNIIRTPNWDVIVRNEICKFEDRIALVFGRDGLPGQTFGIGPTYYFVHRNYIEALGYFNPEQFHHYSGDVWMHDVAIRADRCAFVPTLFIEHLHWTFGKAINDSVYTDAYVHIHSDDALYACTAAEREEHANRLKTFIKNFKK